MNLLQTEIKNIISFLFYAMENFKNIKHLEWGSLGYFGLPIFNNFLSAIYLVFCIHMYVKICKADLLPMYAKELNFV